MMRRGFFKGVMGIALAPVVAKPVPVQPSVPVMGDGLLGAVGEAMLPEDHFDAMSSKGTLSRLLKRNMRRQALKLMNPDLYQDLIQLAVANDEMLPEVEDLKSVSKAGARWISTARRMRAKEKDWELGIPDYRKRLEYEAANGDLGIYD